MRIINKDALGNLLNLFQGLLALALFLPAPALQAQPAEPCLRLAASPADGWWAMVVNHGHLMPLEEAYQANLWGNLYGNQAQPLLLSARGEVVWSEEPFELSFTLDSLIICPRGGKIQYSRPGASLRDAYANASRNFFPPSGHMPDEALFAFPQYNTWIELMYDQNQEDILRYARAIIANGMPPGVLMIDDNWQEYYGGWRFHPGRFPAPKAMMDSLHGMGFKVMVWVCPFVSADSEVYRSLRGQGFLLRERGGEEPAIIRWWNGASALLDFTHPGAVQWFGDQLQHLVDEYGVDGFKLDAGDPEYYLDVESYKPASPNRHAELFGQFGLRFPLNEYRAMWKMGGQPLAQRLRDKTHSWEDLRKLIPHALLEGLAGYPFTCPDMIGGGEYSSFLNLEAVDQELIVRSAQCHALMPMMQFSVAPWRILGSEEYQAVLKAVHIRRQFRDYILSLAREAAISGEPIMRPMEYDYPHSGYLHVKDQFLMGDKLLVAPVLEENAGSRTVLLPPGKWRSYDGKVLTGPQRLTIKVSLESLPYFEKL